MRCSPVLGWLTMTLSVSVGACKGAEPTNRGSDSSPRSPLPPAPSVSAESADTSKLPPALPPPADAAPDDGAYLSGKTWITCMDGFQARATPPLDLLRLGMLCGPYHGMRKLGEPLVGKLGAGASQRYPLEAKRDQCFRVFAVSTQELKRFTLRAYGPSSDKLAESTIAQRFGALGADGVFCMHEAGNGQVEIQALEGQGDYAMQLWLLP